MSCPGAIRAPAGRFSAPSEARSTPGWDAETAADYSGSAAPTMTTWRAKTDIEQALKQVIARPAEAQVNHLDILVEGELQGLGQEASARRNGWSGCCQHARNANNLASGATPAMPMPSSARRRCRRWRCRAPRCRGAESRRNCAPPRRARVGQDDRLPRRCRLRDAHVRPVGDLVQPRRDAKAARLVAADRGSLWASTWNTMACADSTTRHRGRSR